MFNLHNVFAQIAIFCPNCKNIANLQPRRESTIPGAQWEVVTKWGELIWLDASSDRNRRIKSPKIHDFGTLLLSFLLILKIFMFDLILML